MKKGFRIAKRRRFICKKCNRKSQDPDVPDFVSTTKDKIEFENVDLCNQCFKDDLKRNKQNYILLFLSSKNVIIKEEMDKLVLLAKEKDKKEYEIFRSSLLRRNCFKKGEFKIRKKEMINKLFEKQKLNKRYCGALKFAIGVKL